MSMRDLLDSMPRNDRPDPMEAARRAMRTQLLRRFYAQAGVGVSSRGFSVLLDSKPVRTPGRRVLEAPVRAIAAAVAAEWQRQGDTIDPTRMPLTRLANSIIDGVAPAPEPVAAEIEKYLRSDLLFYRADAPEGLVARQAGLWDPVIQWAHEALGARFMLAQGVSFVAQPERAVSCARSAIPTDPWRLGAVHAMTTLTGSALLALAVLRRRLDVETAWRAAHVDEDWNMEQWGRDELALERRAFRHAEMRAAAAVIEAMG